jgi:hypothetical protein
LKGYALGVLARSEDKIAGDILQPHPPPCAILLSRTRSEGIFFSWLLNFGF